jgi:hypothetical protein
MPFGGRPPQHSRSSSKWHDDFGRKGRHGFQLTNRLKWSYRRGPLQYQRGSNGAAQALIDARTMADLVQKSEDALTALATYESARRGPTTKVVETNRSMPPDFINIRVEELTGDRPFDDLDKYVSQHELRALSDNYKRIAGFSRQDLG